MPPRPSWMRRARRALSGIRATAATSIDRLDAYERIRKGEDDRDGGLRRVMGENEPGENGLRRGRSAENVHAVEQHFLKPSTGRISRVSKVPALSMAATVVVVVVK